MVLDTRGAVRRRECANLHRFFTEEMPLGPSSTALKPIPEEWQVARMMELIEKNNGNRAAAAREMGITVNTFNGRLKMIQRRGNDSKGL